jgi:hypothetical protein
MSHFLSHDCPKSTMREYVHMYQFSLLKSKNQWILSHYSMCIKKSSNLGPTTLTDKMFCWSVLHISFTEHAFAALYVFYRDI